MHNPAPVLENNTRKLLCDFDIHLDQLISARRQDLLLNKKERTCKIVDFAVPADDRIKLKECEKKDKNIDLVLYSHLLIHAEIYIYMLDTYRCNNN